ncbi:3'-5' exoribonuclease [Empedobacter sp. GD03797]|uniref:3'-5' exonuclease n=1 Tax=Empedobacter sp. GD03797 TaxID=2975382 RepID=UPI00244CF649|nr:3'-5' exoribonuclease [Empedobacter sp. GD03797]MDH1883945.1 3'-5' exoribonuclease [Empedobacter sp. GD03797]
MMNNIMIDIETLSTEFDAVILSIAAVRFDISTGIKDEDNFYTKVDKQSCIDFNLKMNPETVDWWMQQEDKARQEFLSTVNRKNIKDALKDLSNFILETDKVWSNGATFDLVILRSAYKACKLKLPWEFYNERDVRTLSDLIPTIKENEPFVGTKHNPLFDCMHQIKYCSKVYQQLNLENTH